MNKQLPLPEQNQTFEIKLTDGFTTVVDSIDADVTKWLWRAKSSSGWIYARRENGTGNKRRTIILHRVILERVLGRPLAAYEKVDHIDGNSLNNVRANLRLCTTSQNACNARTPSSNTSGFKGVTWNRKSGKWQAGIKHNGKSYHLGLFDSPEAAHDAYRKAAVEHFGEFARFS